ncbi:hypothetical protein OQA88_5223 [Cercophora sp. LCS_1]
MDGTTGYKPLRYFSASDPLPATLAVDSVSGLKSLYAQHMLSVFMRVAGGHKDSGIDGEVQVRSTEPTRAFRGRSGDAVALSNAKLSKMVQDMSSTGLGTPDEIYLAVIPQLSAVGKLPRPDAIVNWARGHARIYEGNNNWKGVSSVYVWLFQTAESFPQSDRIVTKATALLMECLRALIEDIDQQNAEDLEDETRSLTSLMENILNKLRRVRDNTLLPRLMGLYERQGRPWQCDAVAESIPVAGQDADLSSIPDIMTDEGEADRGPEGDILDWTPSHYAAATGSSSFSTRLLSDLVDVDKMDIRGRIPLHYACQRDDSRAVLKLTRATATLNARDVRGMVPIHLAAAHDNVEIVRSLVMAGAETDVVDSSAMSPLLWAAFRGHVGVVRELWKDAKTNRRDRNGRTILHLATLDFKSHKSEERSLMVTKFVLDEVSSSNLDVNTNDRFGMTALHISARHNHAPAAKLLLDSGADIHARNTEGETPLQTAGRWGNTAIEKLLLEHAADIEGKNVLLEAPRGLASSCTVSK